MEGFNINTGQYSSAVIKALTYTLVLHPIALAATVLTLLFGLLAHCGDMSLRCLNSVFASIASLITLVAVGCDFALFIIAQKRINAINGASASLGSALWMTLIAWILILLSSFTFCCSCCGSGGGRSGKKNKMRDEYDDEAWKGGPNRPNGGNNYADQMRMDALDAEADRRRRNKSDLPKFAVYETEHVESLPLKQDFEEHSGAAGFAANGGGQGGRGGQGYDGQYGYYGNEYGAGPEHGTGYAYGYADGGPGHQPSESYIPGVGPGAQRTVPPTAAYYDGSQGPHTPSAHEGPSTYPGYNDQASSYAHSQSHRAPSMASNMSHGYSRQGGAPPPVPMLSSAVPEPGQSERGYGAQQHEYGYASAGQGQHPSTAGGGHAVDYSGATFGGDPYDAVQQATAAGRARALPRAPSRDRDRASGIPYSPTSPSAAGGRAGSSLSPGVAGDDGFGLAVLQAGAAAAAVGPSQSRHDSPARVTSPGTYDDAEREMWAAPTRSRPLPSAPIQRQDDGYSEEGSHAGHQAPPPGYDTERAYEHRHPYPHEKH